MSAGKNIVRKCQDAQRRGAMEERLAIVTWLHRWVDTQGMDPEKVPAWLADMISEGEHLVPRPKVT